MSEAPTYPTLEPHERAILDREVDVARQTLAEALEDADPLKALASLTFALDTLAATQSELINTLLNRGTRWSTIAEALSTDTASARRRFPRPNRMTTGGQNAREEAT